MARTKEKLINKELRRAVIKAFRSVAKMIREEPNPIVISDGSSSNSDGTFKEITGWLFRREQ
jgi:hypothetical protein